MSSNHLQAVGPTMRRLRSLGFIFALGASATLPLQAVTEMEALARLRGDLERMMAALPRRDGTAAGSAQFVRTFVKELVTQMSKVDTEGLPPGLITAFNDVLTIQRRRAALFADFPDTPAERDAYIKERVARDPGFVQKFQSEFKIVNEQLGPKTKALDEALVRHGLQPIGPDVAGGAR